MFGEEEHVGLPHPFAKVHVPVGDHAVIRGPEILDFAPRAIWGISEHPRRPVGDGLSAQGELLLPLGAYPKYGYMNFICYANISNLPV